MDLIPNSCYDALRNARLQKYKSISLQPCCCVLCSRRISGAQQGQPYSGLTEVGVMWGCGKEPQNNRMCMKHCPHLCFIPGAFYSLVVYFLLPFFPSYVPLFHKHAFFFFF